MTCLIVRAWDGQPSEGELQRREDQHIHSPGTLDLHDSTPGASGCAVVGVHGIFGADRTSYEARTKSQPGFISRCSGKNAVAFSSLPTDQAIKIQVDNLQFYNRGISESCLVNFVIDAHALSAADTNFNLVSKIGHKMLPVLIKLCLRHYQEKRSFTSSTISHVCKQGWILQTEARTHHQCVPALLFAFPIPGCWWRSNHSTAVIGKADLACE